MSLDDGRIVTGIIKSFLKDEPLIIYGSGEQTRSLSFVDDTIEQMIGIMKSDYNRPVNIGNNQEFSVNQIIQLIHELIYELVPACDRELKIIYQKQDQDDPKVRQPDLELNHRLLGIKPLIPLSQGLRLTIQSFLGGEPQVPPQTPLP